VVLVGQLHYGPHQQMFGWVGHVLPVPPYRSPVWSGGASDTKARYAILGYSWLFLRSQDGFSISLREKYFDLTISMLKTSKLYYAWKCVYWRSVQRLLDLLH